MTVYEFRKISDFSATCLEYVVLLSDEHKVTLWFSPTENKWVDDDAHYDWATDELEAEVILTQEELDDAEIISIKLGSYTEVTVRL